MWKKIKTWAKKYWGIIAGAVVFVVGFIVGKFTGRTTADFDKLRAVHAELTERLRKREEELRTLANLHASDGERYKHLEAELDRARNSLAKLGDSIVSGQGNIESLKTNNSDLRNWIQKYGKTVTDIQGAE